MGDVVSHLGYFQLCSHCFVLEKTKFVKPGHGMWDVLNPGTILRATGQACKLMKGFKVHAEGRVGSPVP